VGVCRGGDSDPVSTFREEVKRGWRGDVKGPFNVEDREKAGLTPQFYEGLRGEIGLADVLRRKDKDSIDGLTNGVASLKIEYDSQR